MLLTPEPPHRSCQGVNMPRKNVLSFILAKGQLSKCACVCLCVCGYISICGIVCVCVWESVCRRVYVGFRVGQLET